MQKLALYVYGLCFAASITLAYLGWQTFDPVQRQQREAAARYAAEAQRIAAERAQFQLEQDRAAAAQVAPIKATLAQLTVITLQLVLLGGVVYSAIFVGYAIRDQYLLRRRPLVRADERGMLPVARRLLEQDTTAALASVQAWHQTRTIEAARQPVPQTLTYAPHYSAKHDAALLPVGDTRPPLTLPPFTSLDDVLPQIKRLHLAYGILPDGSLLQLPLARGYHALMHGDTRSGKSTAIDSMLVQLHRMAGSGLDLTLRAADYKQELAAAWARSSLFAEGIQTEPRAIAEMLADLVNGPDGVKARYASFKAYNESDGRAIKNLAEYAQATGTRPRLTVCLIDELNAAIGAASKQDGLAEALKVLLQLGAGAGIFVMGGAQYLNAATLGRDGSKQFVTRAHFGAWDSTAVRMLFGSLDQDVAAQVRPLIDGTPGRGLVRFAGSAQPTAFQGLHVSESNILDAMRCVAPRQDARSAPVAPERYGALQQGATARYSVSDSGATPLRAATGDMPESAHTEAHAPPRSASVAVSEAERVSILSALERLTVEGQTPSRRAVCEAVFGTTGGAGYRKVAAVLDAPHGEV